ncbi:MAG TPA: glycosyltransferase [Ferruginibacter sp.]|nr:glycosyltransferase [Ferruginibacter sp.]
MLLFLLLVSVVFAIYLFGMIWARHQWNNCLPVLDGAPDVVFFSILIPARNEAERIRPCLESIRALNYADDLFEVLVIDDHSTDETASLVQQFQQQMPNLRLIRLADHLSEADHSLLSYKKKAIETGVALSQGSWMVTTDADCMVPANWLQRMAMAINQWQPDCLVMPVKMIREKNNADNWLSIFQQLDFLSLQGITGMGIRSGKLYLSNGANFAYQKKLFLAVNGFQEADDIASGDDLLLLHKFHFQAHARIEYLQSTDVMVSTPVEPTIASFIQQRRRWAGKSNRYLDKKILPVMLLVFAVNLLIVLSAIRYLLLPGGLCTSWGCISYGQLTLVLLLIKTTGELCFIWPVARFFKQQSLLWYFPLMQPLHVLYTVVMAFLGQAQQYEWKGRRVR